MASKFRREHKWRCPPRGCARKPRWLPPAGWLAVRQLGVTFGWEWAKRTSRKGETADALASSSTCLAAAGAFSHWSSMEMAPPAWPPAPNGRIPSPACRPCFAPAKCSPCASLLLVEVPCGRDLPTSMLPFVAEQLLRGWALCALCLAWLAAYAVYLIATAQPERTVLLRRS